MNTHNSRIHRTLSCMIQTNQGQLRRVPNHVLALTAFVCVSVLLQGVADVGLKLISYSSIAPALPWRTDFLFLTIISVLMGYRTLGGMRNRKFDVTRNSIELGLLVEIALVVGDIEFIRVHMASMPHILYMRLPFIVFTTLNIFILIYNYRALCLRKWWCAK